MALSTRKNSGGVQFPGGEETANDDYDRSAGNHVGTDAVGRQRAQHANMREPARRAPTQHEADREPVFQMRSGWGREVAVQLSSQHVQARYQLFMRDSIRPLGS